MYTIGQFSVMTKIPAKTLRYYDEIDLLKPARVDPYSGYRFYDEESLLLVQQILIFKKCRMPLEIIKKLLLKAGKEATLKDILKSQLESLNAEIERINESRETVAGILESIENTTTEEISVTDRAERHVLAVRIRGGHEAIGEALSSLFSTAANLRMKVTGPHSIIWHDEKDFESELMEMEICIPVEKQALPETPMYRLIEGRRCCGTMFKGNLSTLGSAYGKMFSFIEENNLKICGPAEETYFPGEEFINPASMNVEIMLPVEELK